MARALWAPWMKREYGLSPRDLRCYTPRELNALCEDFKVVQQREEAMRDGGT